MTTKQDSLDVATTSQGAPARTGAPQSVLDVFGNGSFKAQVAAALPRHIGVDTAFLGHGARR